MIVAVSFDGPKNVCTKENKLMKKITAKLIFFYYGHKIIR